MVYKYHAPPEGCFSASNCDYQRVYPAHEGLVVLEIPGGNLIQVSDRLVDLPKAYGVERSEETVTWNFVRIENETHLLPVAFEEVIYVRSGPTRRVSAEYVNHRHFEANSSITFAK